MLGVIIGAIAGTLIFLRDAIIPTPHTPVFMARPHTQQMVITSTTMIKAMHPEHSRGSVGPVAGKRVINLTCVTPRYDIKAPFELQMR